MAPNRKVVNDIENVSHIVVCLKSVALGIANPLKSQFFSEKMVIGIYSKPTSLGKTFVTNLS